MRQWENVRIWIINGVAHTVWASDDGRYSIIPDRDGQPVYPTDGGWSNKGIAYQIASEEACTKVEG